MGSLRRASGFAAARTEKAAIELAIFILPEQAQLVRPKVQRVALLLYYK
jgi:hypothetical protein